MKMERKQIEEIGRLLGLNTEQLESLFVACPVGGWAGHEVAAELCQRFGLEADEPLGKQLWAAGVLTQAQGRWLDDEDEDEVTELCDPERTFPLGGGEYIDLLEDGSFTARSLRTDGGDIVYIGSFWDAETETDHAAELEVSLSESVEDLLPEWEEATGEEISAACEHSWVEWRVDTKDPKIDVLALYTVTEAAEALELSEPRVRTLCQEGRMGRKVGRDWVITAEEIEAMRDRPGPGRPRKMVPCDVIWSKALGEVTLYALGEACGRFFFSWSEFRWPTQTAGGDEVPAKDVEDGENGVKWFDTLKEATRYAEDVFESLDDEEWAWEAVDELTSGRDRRAMAE